MAEMTPEQQKAIADITVEVVSFDVQSITVKPDGENEVTFVALLLEVEDESGVRGYMRPFANGEYLSQLADGIYTALAHEKKGQ